jgi:uncharacterized protein YegP (UPF0339 family)
MASKKPIATVYFSRKLGKKGFRFRMKGKNGEPLVNGSQFYTRKESVMETLKNNYPNFEIRDEAV